LQAGDGVSVPTIARRIGITEDAAREAMEYLKKLPDFQTGNRIVVEVAILDEFDRKEPLYAINGIMTSTVLLLLAGADTILHPPGSFAFAIGCTDDEMFKRDQLDFLKKPGKK
jgi:hypothetical protein